MEDKVDLPKEEKVEKKEEPKSEEKKEDQQVSKKRRKNAPKIDGDDAIRRRSTRSRVNILQF